MDIKTTIAKFLRSHDTSRFTLNGINYYFHQEEDLCVVEKLTRDVYLKLLILLKKHKLDVLYVTSYNKTADSLSTENITVFYSVTFKCSTIFK